jgi:hypothetical protein
VITTPDLIDALTADAAPVRPLRAPILRAALWLLFAACILALVGISHGVRPDFARKAAEFAYIVGVAAALLTGVLAAAAAFLISLPDRSPRWVLLPLPALVVWVSTVGYGCLTAWVGLGPEDVRIADLAECFATLVLVGIPIWAALLFMLRHAARWRPAAATMMGSLAVAAIAATGLLVFHTLDASLMILVWHLGGAGAVLALGAVLGRGVLSRITPSLRA